MAECMFVEKEITDSEVSVVELTEFERDGEKFLNIFTGYGEGTDIKEKNLSLLEKCFKQRALMRGESWPYAHPIYP